MKNYNENEVPKYKKKKNKTVKKSGHKHEYKECLVYVDEVNGYLLCEYCVKCNKVKGVKLVSTEDEELGNGHLRLMSNKEILKKYKDLPMRRIKNLDSKYLD